MKSFDKFHSESVAAAIKKPAAKTFKKLAGAVLAAKSGDEILKGLLGTPGRPKSTDWDTNPKDDIDSELNVRQGQVKDAEKNKEFDKEMGAYRRGKDNLTSDEKIDILKRNAKLKNNKKDNVVPMRKPKKNVQEDRSSKPVYGDGHDYSKGLALTGRLDFGKGKKSEYDVGLSYKGTVLARKTRTFDKPEKTSPKDAVDAALNKLNHKTPDKGGKRTT